MCTLVVCIVNIDEILHPLQILERAAAEDCDSDILLLVFLHSLTPPPVSLRGSLGVYAGFIVMNGQC